jgi:hypothetical protein
MHTGTGTCYRYIYSVAHMGIQSVFPFEKLGIMHCCITQRILKKISYEYAQ